MPNGNSEINGKEVFPGHQPWASLICFIGSGRFPKGQNFLIIIGSTPPPSQVVENDYTGFNYHG